MANPLAGHTNSYHTYSHDEALQGIAEAGYSARRAVGASRAGRSTSTSTPTRPSVRRKLEGYGLEPVSLSRRTPT